MPCDWAMALKDSLLEHSLISSDVKRTIPSPKGRQSLVLLVIFAL